MAWSAETIIAFVTLLVTCFPLMMIWSYVKRKLRKREPDTSLLPQHQLRHSPISETLNENDTRTNIPGLLIKLKPYERSIDMQIFMAQNNLSTATSSSEHSLIVPGDLLPVSRLPRLESRDTALIA